ncbi:hypothetical protein [Tissierella praeacuta]|uniref:hypothetical protein n=1 Tax=Tissierella praeacuta TaxID=43131 RepID=UPI002FD92067
MKNLWGDINDAEKISAPKEILKKQAEYLEHMTRGKVEARVKNADYVHLVTSSDTRELVEFDFIYDFYIISKNVPNYTFSMMKVAHNIDFYPIIIRMEPSIYSDVEKRLKDLRIKVEGSNNIDVIVIDEDQFMDALSLILSSTKVKKVINRLLSFPNEDDIPF